MFPWTAEMIYAGESICLISIHRLSEVDLEVYDGLLQLGSYPLYQIHTVCIKTNTSPKPTSEAKIDVKHKRTANISECRLLKM